ncbi:MAG: Microtubule-associated protein, microtubule dynamics during spindle orientation [Stictis urceolatum]|nr:Microtubule-associated protein, microtubule dynamics during spindle orientation [Stictis urceolata]
MGDQEEDFSQLPLPDRFTHKVWKVRKEGYEAAAKEFEQAEDASSPVFRPFISDSNLMKVAVADSNVAAQQEGLGALCSFLKHGAGDCATRTRPVTLGPIVEKGVPSTRAGVKQNALEALMLYVEITKPDPVIEEIMAMFGHKQPKIIAASLSALTTIFHVFGVKIVDPVPVLKALPKVFGHSDKNVRVEATNLCVELYRWLKDAMKPLFWGDLKDLQQQDLEKKFEAVKAEPAPKQERLTRAQQIAAAAAAEQIDQGVAAGPEAEEGIEEVEDEDEPAIAISVNVLEKVPQDFLENVGSSKWKDRKEALEAFHAVANVPKIDPGPFDDIVSALGKCMKDANVMVVVTAANCVEDLSKGLKRDFTKYKGRVMGPMMERLKEKKQNVADALGAALDGVFLATSLSDCLEEILEFLKHKTPQVKQESLKFLIRCLKNTRTAPSMPETKSIADAGTKMMTDSVATTRDGGAEVMGTLMKIMGDKPMAPFLDSLDDIRKAKVKEFCDAAVVKAKNKPKPPPAAKAAPKGPPPAATRKVVKKAPASLGAKKSAPTAAPRPASPTVDPTPSPAPKSVSRPTPTSRLGGPSKSGLTAPSGGLRLQKKLAGPGGAPTPNMASPARRTISSTSISDTDAAPAQPKLGLGRGLAGRSLAKPTQTSTHDSAPPAAALSSGLTAIERAELEELRTTKSSLNTTIDDFRAQISKHEADINALRTHEAELIEERTRNRLTIKAKETQLVRARSDAEVAEEQVQRQQREIERLKRELARSVRATSPPPADVSDQIYRDMSANGRITPAGYDRYESARASREAGYQRARSYMTSPSEEKENGGAGEFGVGKGRSPGRFERRGSERGVERGSEGSRAESPRVSGDGVRGEVSDGQPIESWRRAAEVTSQLKARIEQMKARQGLGRPH